MADSASFDGASWLPVISACAWAVFSFQSLLLVMSEPSLPCNSSSGSARVPVTPDCSKEGPIPRRITFLGAFSELIDGRIVERSAYDGASGCWAGRRTMAVLEERIAKVCIRTSSFAGGPPVIRARNAVVNFFKGILTDVVNEHSAGAWLEGEGERI